MSEERTTTGGPVISDSLYSFATLQLRDEVRKRLAAAAVEPTRWVEEQIREAYMRGLVHGFSQGVASAHTPNGTADKREPEADAIEELIDAAKSMRAAKDEDEFAEAAHFFDAAVEGLE